MSGFTPIEWMKESWREACDQVEGEKRHKEKKALDILQDGKGSITFRESSEFYTLLDQLVDLHECVTICFDKERPNEKSKIWNRLRQCENWSDLEHEFQHLKENKRSPLINVLSPSMTAALTGGEILLIAFIASLVFGVVLYAVYKNYKVKLRVNPETGDGELILEPT